MLDRLKAELVDALTAAIHARFGAVELPPLVLGLPPQVELGDFTFGVFPLAKPLRKGPPIIARELAEAVTHPALVKVEAVGPYLNLTVAPPVLFQALIQSVLHSSLPFGFHTTGHGKRVMVEYSSPNTNKPLHIGHLRNNLLGYSVSRILAAVGYDVIKACLVNDRGIHICKSMLGYQRFFAGQTPQSRQQKGDHFVGEIYVTYEKALKAEKDALAASLSSEGLTGEALEKAVDAGSPLLQATHELLRQWEAGNPEVRALWETMNGWVYEGFEQTYREMGVSFDQYYYESQLYQSGRARVLEALERGLVTRRPDGAVAIDLSEDGLDPKVLLRADGTSLYITQDIGVALQKWADHQPERSIYVIGNEQDHQMKVLFIILKRLGYAWASGCFHLSYGMVSLPEGRMKSREGKVIDADDLMHEMVKEAREELDKRQTEDGEVLQEAELQDRARAVAMGGIKFFFLKTNPRKDFMFNPAESIQFQGDTGPYVQYTHARIKSILRKAAERGHVLSDETMVAGSGALETLGNLEERGLARTLVDFPRVVAEAAERLQPSSIASQLLEVAAAFNKFYHEHQILRATDTQTLMGRLALAAATARVLATGLELLGIEAPEAM